MLHRSYLAALASLVICSSVLSGPFLMKGECLASPARYHRSAGGDSLLPFFRVRYSGLVKTPPVSGDMPAEIRQAYLYLDSLLRSRDAGDRVRRIGGVSEAGSDLLFRMVRSVYTVTDYDPATFAQYADQVEGKRGRGYVNSLRVFTGTLFNQMRDNMPGGGAALYSMLLADYILRVRVVAIDSVVDPRDPAYNQYRATVQVLDTLKGRMFRNAGAPDGSTAAGAFIQFQYVPGNYFNPAEPSIDRDAPAIPYRLTDPAFTVSGGHFGMHGGQEAIVFLRHADYRTERDGASYVLRLEPGASYNALPIVDGAVRDVNHIWSENDTRSYGEWRERFMQLRSAITGG